MSRSASPLLLQWLAERSRNHSIHICQFSHFKASFHEAKENRTNSLYPGQAVDRFVKRHFSPEAILFPTEISTQVYLKIRARLDHEDFEIFAYAAAITRDYTYVCVDAEEAETVRGLVPELRIALLEEILGDANPFES
jgi:hypothetical protein